MKIKIKLTEEQKEKLHSVAVRYDQDESSLAIQLLGEAIEKTYKDEIGYPIEITYLV